MLDRKSSWWKWLGLHFFSISRWWVLNSSEYSVEWQIIQPAQAYWLANVGSVTSWFVVQFSVLMLIG